MRNLGWIHASHKKKSKCAFETKLKEHQMFASSEKTGMLMVEL